MEQALADIRIVDLTQYIAGPYCTKLLADYGADVIKVERVDGGDPARRLGPFWRDAPHLETSGLFLHLNTNKRGVTLNLKTVTGRKLFLELVAWADAVIENFAPHVMPGLGLSYQELDRVKPGIVMTSISNFGQTGPYRDFKLSDIVLYAMGGEMYATGAFDREPLKLYDSVPQYQVGACAAAATMGALFAAKVQGVGQHVDVSCLEVQAGSIDRRAPLLLSYAYTGDIGVETRTGGSTGGFIPVGIFPCADGYFSIQGATHFWSRIVKMLGDPPELHDPKWTLPEANLRPDLKRQFDDLFLTWSMQRTKRDVFAAAREAGMMLAPCYTMAELLDDSHFAERGVFAACDHPVVGHVPMVGRPFVMSETPWQLRRPAPLLGQHNREVLGDLGYGADDVVRLREAGVV